jgi:1-acyl-sn-glycerol-3-phosphate acyltransferase
MRRLGHRTLGFITYYSFFFYLVLLPALIPGESPELFRSRLRRAIKLSLHAFGVKLVVRGAEHLAVDTNAIIVANHSSWFDQLALLAVFDQPITFMANKKYFRYVGLARVLRKLECVPTTTETALESIQAARKVLDKGVCLVVYPEGTRSTKRLPFRRGAALLAEKTRIPVQPIVIVGAHDVLPRRAGLWKVQPGTIEINVQPRLMYAQATPKEFMARIEEIYANLDEARTSSSLFRSGSAHTATGDPHVVATNPESLRVLE